jgi:carbon-monoxide dehydrogenase medium subunit
MSLRPQYARPTSVPQAVQLLDGLGTGAIVIAGGQDVMPHVNYGRLMPSVFVDIGALRELQGVAKADGAITIGALTVHRELQVNEIIRRHVPLLAQAAGQVGGGWQIHNRGTIGGNLVAMHPLYDLAPPLLALGAEVEIASASGTRRLALSSLLVETSHGLGTRSLLVRIIIRPLPPTAGWAYEKIKITEGSYGSANAAVVVGLEGEHLSSAQLVIGAVAERPIDASGVVMRLADRVFGSSGARDLAHEVAQLCAQPLSDQQGDGSWRRAMAGVAARRALARAVASVRGSSH